MSAVQADHRFSVSSTDADGTVVVSGVCLKCDGGIALQLPEAGLIDWSMGALIQDALPGVTPEDREWLITGICSACWEASF